MNSFKPKTPSGSDAEARFMQWVNNWLAQRLKFINTPTVRWDVTTQGVAAHAAPARGGGVGLVAYRVKSRLGDILTCRTFDGTTEGSSDVLVAVPLDARSVNSETLDGTTFTYTYSPATDLNRSRTNNSGELQQVVPLWREDGLIVAAPVNYPGSLWDGEETDDEVKLIEVSSRCWARI